MSATGIHYLITEDAQTALERAQHALKLLADLNAAAARGDDVSADGTAAIADYVARDLAEVLATARVVNVPAGGEP